jgi:hypothetical protein
MQNVKRKHYNIGKQSNKNEVAQTEGIEKNKYYKKINKNKNYNLFNNEINNNYHVVQVDKLLLNKIKTQNLLNSKISNSYNSNYYKNLNFINTLYQKVNNNGVALKNNNYFSNRDEMDDFIKKNKINFSKLNFKNDIIFRKDITKSEKPTERKNNFMNLDDIFKNKDTCNNSEKNKNNEIKRFSKNNSYNNIDIIEEEHKRNELVKSYPTGSDFIKLKNDIKTPRNTSNKKGTISITENKINENINIDNFLKQIKVEDRDDEIYNEDELRSWIYCLHSALRHFRNNVKNNLIVYRGVNLKLPGNIRVGSKFFLREFCSTSATKTVGEQYASDGTLFIIKIKNNGINQNENYCLNIKEYSQFPDEDEILITCHCYFSVTCIQRRAYNHVYGVHFDKVYLDCEGYKFD